MPLPYKLIMIESRTIEDQEMGFSEQDVLRSVFEQLRIRAKVIEVFTPAQFYQALRRASSEHVGYVHFSGHGSPSGVLIGATEVTWEDIDQQCWPNLKNVCFTFSSCDVAKGVSRIFERHKTFCAAVVAATRKVDWAESAVAFSAFYLRSTRDDSSTEQDVRTMNHICGSGTFKVIRASRANQTSVLE